MQNTLESLQTSEDWFEVYQSTEQVYSQGFPTSEGNIGVGQLDVTPMTHLPTGDVTIPRLETRDS